MKTKKFKRTIRPEKGSKAKLRPGILDVVDRTPESIEELEAQLQEEGDALARLKSIIAEAESHLISTKFYSSQKEIYTKEIDPGIEAASPEHHAISAIRFAARAMKHMEAGNVDAAVRAAMGASFNDVMVRFTRGWEPIIARAIAQTPTPPKEKRKKWASAIANELIKQGHRTFPAAWNSISENDGDRYDGFEVYRDGNNLVAEKYGKKDILPKESFRTGYYQKQKNQK